MLSVRDGADVQGIQGGRQQGEDGRGLGKGRAGGTEWDRLRGRCLVWGGRVPAANNRHRCDYTHDTSGRRGFEEQEATKRGRSGRGPYWLLTERRCRAIYITRRLRSGLMT